MNDRESLAVLELARSRTWQERRRALQQLASCRLKPEDKAVIVGLCHETHALDAHALRPLPAAQNGRLEMLSPGPDPVLSEHALADVAEWCEGWSRAEELRAAGLEAPGPLLLRGPPGTGKTMLTRAIARRFEDRMPAFVLDAHRVVESHMGETGAALTTAFAACASSGLLVLEEIDALGGRRSDSANAIAGEQNRITIALMRLLDAHPRMPVAMTTNRVDTLDEALLRRCEMEIELPEPSISLRVRVVETILGPAPGWFASFEPLIAAVPRAKRARRRSVLAGKPEQAWAFYLAGEAAE